jgi:hypothetical protein
VRQRELVAGLDLEAVGEIVAEDVVGPGSSVTGAAAANRKDVIHKSRQQQTYLVNWC